MLPEVAKALGVPLDVNFVSFVPLGGRHVNHFWKLLRTCTFRIHVAGPRRWTAGGGWGKSEVRLQGIVATVSVERNRSRSLTIGKS